MSERPGFTSRSHQKPTNCWRVDCHCSARGSVRMLPYLKVWCSRACCEGSSELTLSKRATLRVRGVGMHKCKHYPSPRIVDQFLAPVSWKNWHFSSPGYLLVIQVLKIPTFPTSYVRTLRRKLARQRGTIVGHRNTMPVVVTHIVSRIFGSGFRIACQLQLGQTRYFQCVPGCRCPEIDRPHGECQILLLIA